MIAPWPARRVDLTGRLGGRYGALACDYRTAASSHKATTSRDVNESELRGGIQHWPSELRPADSDDAQIEFVQFLRSGLSISCRAMARCRSGFISHSERPSAVCRRPPEIKASSRATVTISSRASPRSSIEHYIKHWNERIGHLVMFEALPNTGDAVSDDDRRRV